MNNIFDFSKIMLFITEQTEKTYKSIVNYMYSLPNAKLLAVSLFLATIMLFFVLIFVWYIKTILRTARNERRAKKKILAGIDPRLDRKIVTTEDDEVVNNSHIKYSQEIDFDWDKNATFSDVDFKISGDYQYRLKPQKLEKLLGLIVDLLQRGVDEPKIAQTIMYKNQHLNTEDDIIQTITAIKFFIYLCLNKRFKKIDTDKMLPQENAAIFHIAKGDCSLALVLLEALIDSNIAKIKRIPDPEEKERRWCETSNCATIFGTLAAFENKDLAAAAFELAIELNPRNITAWGRIGDMYVQTEKTDKAVWAYSNVINLADEGIYTQQIANANKMLAMLYNEQGKRHNADEMAQKSQRFYDGMGINVPLTERETKIVYIIESKEDENMEAIVDNLLQKVSANQANEYL